MLERGLESILFRSRWLMAPFYLGLVVALLVLLFKFGHELLHFVLHALEATESDTILGILTLVDLTFTGNLVLIVIFSGYENFVSKIDPNGHPDWPDWMTRVDFSGLKQKLLASIVAISAIQLLKSFMNLEAGMDTTNLMWLVIIHVVFVGSSLVLAFSDNIGAGGAKH
ncbi:TIGR00645 family protein [Xanthobacter sp. DSM 24535]|uniref:TIGR00645 family protein n=1 Tax=Roseixanthobacter psychrophilus TaxID=3119917 RepID=UPI0037270146